VPVSRASRQAWLRWAVVACGAAALCALPLVIAALPVPGSAIGAAVLRARILASARVPYQGYAESNASLGVPHLPDLSGLGTLLDGATDQYVWYRSPGHWRADIISPAGEDDTYQAGAATYLWSYSSNLLTKIIGSQPARLPRAADLLPPALGRRLLALTLGSGSISRLPSRRIAGLAAAGLQVRPAERGTLISAVDIWADPATGLPAAVDVFAGGAGAPVLTSQFLELSESRPAMSVVTPDPAPGVGITTASLPEVSAVLNGVGPALPPRLAGLPRTHVPGGLESVGAYGSGLVRFAVIPLPAQLGGQALSAARHAGAAQLRLADGSAGLIRTALLTVALARSRFGGPVFLLAGPVTPGVLQRAATGLLSTPVILP
jgi:hypothetical protein